jgi:D-3-phosphoglycerate dehydrogenase
MADILLTHPRSLRELKFGAEALSALQALGDVRLNATDAVWEPEALVRTAAGCRVIVADRLTAGSRHVFEALPELVAFVRNAVDVRNIDLQAANDCGVLVTRAGAHFVDSMVELIVAQMVDLSRSLSHYTVSYRSRQAPKPRMGTQLAGKIAGVVGFGQIGRRLAEVLRALKLDVLAFDPHAVVDAPTRPTELEALLAQSDFVICLAGHTPRNTALCDAAFFAAMRRDAWFLNASRGALVDENALHDALTRGVIAGAALDVGSDTDDEPPLRLAALPNVIAAPHVGGLVHENIVGQAMDSVRQTSDILRSRLPDHALNAPEAHRFAAHS